MGIKPTVRYMLLCEDVLLLPDNLNRIHVIGLISNIRSTDEPPYPLLFEELCVYVALTEGRGSGVGRVVVIFEDTETPIFRTRDREVAFGDDPLAVHGVLFRIGDCHFPQAGLYSVQFWFDNEILCQCPLLLR